MRRSAARKYLEQCSDNALQVNDKLLSGHPILFSVKDFISHKGKEQILSSTVMKCPTLVAQGVSARLTGHILEALLLQGELKE